MSDRAVEPFDAERKRRRGWDDAVAAERQRQTEKGYDREHDTEHGIEHLLAWAAEYARRGEHVKGWAIIEAARELAHEHDWREINLGWGVVRWACVCGESRVSQPMVSEDDHDAT